MSTFLVSFIVVNYNRKYLLKRCLESIFKLNYPKDKLEVIVIDNGSKDGSQRLVRELFSTAKLIINPINNYCISNNLAIREAKGEYIGLINNDVELDREWLIRIIEVIREDQKIGAATGKVLLYNKKINSTGHKILSNFYWQDRGFLNKDKEIYNKIEEVEGISHCACIYRRSCLQDVGFLDERFNMYLEDVDMSIRLKNKGWKIFYIPKAICYHRLHGTAGKGEIKYYYERNRLFLVAKYYPSRLEEAIFDKGLFPTVERLNKKFLFLILDQIKQNFNHNIQLEKDLIYLKKKIEEFHKKNKLRILFIRLLYNFLYFIRN